MTNTVDVVSSKMSAVVEQVEVLGAEYGLKIISAILILIVGMWVAKRVKSFVVKLMEKRNVDPTLISFSSSLLLIALQIFVIVAALEKLNIKTTSFVAILGAAGLAVGLALQGSLSNFASGVLMIIFKPFKLGDFVEAGGATGAVADINIFTTVINTPDNKKTIVPNSSVMGGNIINYSANDTRRVDLSAGISYSDDIDKARSAINAVLAEIPEILETPAPDILVSEMADSSVNFAVRPWCKPADYWAVYFGVTEAIKKKFDEEGISIPFPQQDVHLYKHED
jgi:small conductance mechanosensitive channel